MSFGARKIGDGRKPNDPRLVIEAIVYVLRTGGQWNNFGSASAIYARLLEREKAVEGRAGRIR
ncbi:MAG: hypothetical protein CVU31_00410 [Betaproteobacteria bacterium HGW-Betaproteobacteria-4]|jgi:hypothetical protein|nr:MAG: hypothetical protein CVU31_00410 [Betaproteobacteria bacterium HGW-Betaproteobacteria-4]